MRIGRDRNWMTFLAWAGVLGSLGALANGAVIVGDVADRSFRRDGTIGNGTTGTVGAGTQSTGEGGRLVVFVFQLPTPAAGESPLVVSATFTFTITADRPDGAYNIDLYGLPARKDSTVLVTDMYYGPSDPGATLLQDNIVPAVNASVGPVSTSASAGPALADYLNAQYGADGSGAGSWVFLRLNPDVDPPIENSGIDVACANRSTGKPELAITFVPEPAGLVLAGTLIGLLSQRSRARRHPV